MPENLAATHVGPAASPEAAELEARAAALAVPPPAAARGAAESLLVVQFQLGGETYGLAAACLREVQPLRDVTPLPGSPSFVLGLVNIRGQVLSVVDLRRRLALPHAGVNDLTRLLVLRHEGMEFGLAVGDVLGMGRVAVADLDPAPGDPAGHGAAYVRGVTRDALIVLDAVAILTDSGLIVDDRARPDRPSRHGGLP